MAKRKLSPEPAQASRFDAIALAMAGGALLTWIAAPLSPGAGILLLGAGVINFVRLLRWRGWKTSSEALVLILHAGYGWLATAFTLLGLAVLAPAQSSTAAGIHALTAGAFGVMTLAVMTRATLGHTGQALTANRSTKVIYLLVGSSALSRVRSRHSSPMPTVRRSRSPPSHGAPRLRCLSSPMHRFWRVAARRPRDTGTTSRSVGQSSLNLEIGRFVHCRI